MYSRKSLGRAMEPLWTSPVTGCSYKDFPSRTTQSCLLPTQNQIRILTNIWPEIQKDLRLWRRPAWQTLLTALKISSATAWVAPDLLKNPSNFIMYNCQKIFIWLRRPETILEIKKATFFRMINKLITHKFFKDLTKHRQNTKDLRTPPQHSQILGPQMSPSNNLKNKIPSDKYWRA